MPAPRKGWLNIYKYLKPQEKGCWIWEGFIDSVGYGRYAHPIKGYSSTAHRVVYEFFYGDIEPDLEIDHLCSNKSCINPFHMEKVSSHVNTLRSNNNSAINARKTHCIRGHEFTKENTHWYKSFRSEHMSRSCRACKNLRQSKYRSKKHVSIFS
jgi:hypothetical protein